MALILTNIIRRIEKIGIGTKSRQALSNFTYSYMETRGTELSKFVMYNRGVS